MTSFLLLLPNPEPVPHPGTELDAGHLCCISAGAEQVANWPPSGHIYSLPCRAESRNDSFCGTSWVEQGLVFSTHQASAPPPIFAAVLKI